ncbi:MAG: hypothetical protein EXS16_07840, partial [Gemmataceae bacterium]|nr:hypothetical protein [Gemmataceae bacterium]
MAKKKREWSFDKVVAKAKQALLETDSLEIHLGRFHEWSSELGYTPQQYGGLFRMTVSLARWSEALILAAANNQDAWLKIHLVWRYYAFGERVYIDRATQLAGESPELAKRRQLKIGIIEYQHLAGLLMTMAFSAVLGEDEVAHWLGNRCLKMVREKELFVSADALTEGPTQGYLLRLFCLWQNIAIDFVQLGVKNHGPFEGIFANWTNADTEQEKRASCERLERAKRLLFPSMVSLAKPFSNCFLHGLIHVSLSSSWR